MSNDTEDAMPLTPADVERVQRLQERETEARRNTYRAQIAFVRARLAMLEAEGELGLRSVPDAIALQGHLEQQVAFHQALLDRDPVAIQRAITQGEEAALPARVAAGGRR